MALIVLILTSLLYSPKYCFAEISLCAVGDVNFGGRLSRVAHTYGENYFFLKVNSDLRSADLTFANLECTLSNRGKAVPGKKFIFRGEPHFAQVLKKAGFDVLSIANNHSKDYGEEAFLDTLKHLDEEGLVYIGGGENIYQAFEEKIITVRGKKVAFLSFSDVLPYGWIATEKRPGIASFRDFPKVLKKIEEAKKESDYLVVSIHWGNEMSALPSNEQREKAHQIIKAGADTVLGHHPHIFQSIEIYQGKLIAYSLGNFVFSPGKYEGNYSAILNIDIDKWGVEKAVVEPIFIRNGQPEKMRGKKGEKWLKKIKRRSYALQTNWELKEGVLKYESYRSLHPEAFLRFLRLENKTAL